MPDFLEISEQAARAGGHVLLDWVGRFSVRHKGPSDLVTQADLASQEAVRAVIKKNFPQHAFVAEEDPAAVDPSEGYCWIVDPLDGTTNYVHQVPHYAVSIALAHEGQVVAGTIFDPVNGECFNVARGKGAFLNGERLQTSGVTRLADALVAASFSAQVEPDSSEIEQFNAALLSCQGVRRTGSAALNMCYVAAGRFDAFWAMSTKAWDIAAGWLLIEEAGGVVTDLDGSPLSLARPYPVTSATPELHQQFRELLARATAGRATGL